MSEVQPLSLQARSAEALDMAYDVGELGFRSEFRFYWWVAKAVVLALLAISYEIRERP